MIIEANGITPEGYIYLVVVRPDLGHRNGYVAVLGNSPLFRKPYSEGEDENSVDMNVNAHCGLTYSGFLTGWVVGADNPWYFGFDCNHSCDKNIPIDEMAGILEARTNYSIDEQRKIMERYIMVHSMLNDTIDELSECRDLDYVINQCMKLSKDLKHLERKLDGLH